MLMSKFRLRFSTIIRRKLVRSMCMLTTASVESQTGALRFGQEKLLDLSNSSISPFLNISKLKVMEPFYFTKPGEACRYNFVVEEVVAKDIVNNIIGNIELTPTVFVEGNPGLGFITINLINSNYASKILIFDKSELQDVSIAQLKVKYPGIITCFAGNLIQSSVLLRGLLSQNSELDKPLVFIAVTTSTNFFKSLVLNFLSPINIPKRDITIFLVVSSKVLSNLKKKTFSSLFKFHFFCLFKHFFTVEEISEYPPRAFLPLSRSNVENLSLIKISLNEKFFNSINYEDLQEYYIFLRLIGTRKSNRLISLLEKWLPDCGPYLISKGVSMDLEVNDLSLDEIFSLFSLIKKYENYEEFKVLTSKTLPDLWQIK